MRLGLVIYGSLETVSGGFLYDRQLVDVLRSEGHAVEIVALPWRSYTAHLADNGDRALCARLAALDVDLLLQDELNHPSLVYLNPHLAAHGARYPIVSIVHHLRSDEEHPPELRPVYRSVEESYVNSVDGFVYNSSTTQNAVAQLLRGRKPGIVAYPAADHIAPPETGHVHALIDGRVPVNGPLRLVAVGNLIARKGIGDIVEALAILPRGDFTLDVVGNTTIDPAYTEQLRTVVAAQGMEQIVKFHGPLPYPEIGAMLARSHVFVLPSYEGFGIVYLEAMAFGLPVIASTAGAAHEIVSHGENGFLVPPGHPTALARQLTQLYRASPDHMRMLSTAARRRYDEHPTWRASMLRVAHWLRAFKETDHP